MSLIYYYDEIIFYFNNRYGMLLSIKSQLQIFIFVFYLIINGRDYNNIKIKLLIYF